MGVPKFFRWLSERYPAISQLIAENRIPEFDCLYLDMNGIIHNCTHKDSDSPTFRMTEDKMFIAIFNYIEHLFGKIKPKKLFFMAIDGVAPRAKMNQQRARRFRTAFDAEKARDKAIQEGKEMPKEDPFDSNCITPGTEFMAKLTQQLKYFISKKVSEDADWQGVEIVLSGHEVPGEGEHKIMEYIRQAKAQPGYDPNVRHCLYGLDADLIMLGLLSHDPHFCLLREEVTFGRQNQKKSKELEHQNFYLMHLCIVREYLELEFQELKNNESLSFGFDMERIIDDFILMAFFVGNDFLPNLPNLHINEGALALMFKEYKKVLPQLGGYINEQGFINLGRLGVLLDELSEVEFRFFEAEYSDAKWIKAKQNENNEEVGPQRGAVVTQITPAQKDLFKQVKKYVINPANSDPEFRKPMDLSPSLPARDRKFAQQLALDLNLEWKTIENESGDRFIRLNFPATSNDDSDSDDEEAQLALVRVLRRYDNAKVQEVSREKTAADLKAQYDSKFVQWKDEYYREKFQWGLDDEQEMRQLTENYVQGLQWVLFYYYRGVASWPWFYQYHYSPMISDVKKGLKANMDFQLGQPFRPFQQLMGVLPDRSKKIVPTPYHELMTSPDSPIIDFYPRDFELDMNGKKMEWEAVVKIPFIEEKRLLSAMATKEKFLTEEEKRRNDFGATLKFVYDSNAQYTYPSSLPGIFPDLPYCRCVQNIFDLPTMEGLEPYVGLVDGVQLGAAALAGFPSLKSLSYTATLGFHAVNVFQQESRNESMVVSLIESEKRTNVENAKLKLGKRVHVGYPFLQEAKVVKVSDELFDYALSKNTSEPVEAIPHSQPEISQWGKKAERIEAHYSKRLAMDIGPVESTVTVEMLKGLKKLDDGSTVKEFAEVPGMETVHASQLIVDQVISEDQRFIEKAALPIHEEFPYGTKAFFLGEYAYGRPITVTGSEDNKVKCLLSQSKVRQVEFGTAIARNAERLTRYLPAYAVARNLNLNPLALSKLTSSLTVVQNGDKVNVGLNLKFEAKGQKVLGYSRKGESGWEYSPKAQDLIVQYMTNFPEFVATLNANPKGDMMDVATFYPTSDSESKFESLKAWLKEIESKSFERVPLDADQLDSDVVEQIERASDQHVEKEGDTSHITVTGVRRPALLKPSDAEHRLQNQRFSLGDRVAYVAETGKVPIAVKGTVVGLTRTTRRSLLDIVFDQTFMAGTTLGGRCSSFRGQTVEASTVLNLSRPQLVAQTRAGAQRQNTPQSTQLTVPAYGSLNGGSNGQVQLIEAKAPPTLRGSFRGAVLGQSSVRGSPNGNPSPRTRGMVNGIQSSQQHLPFRNGPTNGVTGGDGRGRGSPARSFGPGRKGAGGRGGYAQGVDLMDENAGVVNNNPNFRPHAQRNVPPPASLNTPNMPVRGGRGGRRGNGGRGGRGIGQQRGGAITVQQP
ncbi:MAG: hypothetical protein Q9227_009422 [Pyrenula ochraceoflavens]